jgi:FkbM family methyltransferase
MKQLFYQIIYHPSVNPLILGLIKLIPGLSNFVKFPPSGIINLTLKNRKQIKLYTNQTCHVTSEVYWKGTSSYEYSDIFEKLFERCEVFFDVGANIGYYSIMAGITNPKLKVYAFDPSPGPYHYLSENIRINNLSNVFGFQKALSNQNGKFSFQIAVNSKYSYLKYNSLGGSGHLAGVREDPSPVSVEVEALTLDDFVSSNNIPKIDLIKLDVEEAEHLVIAGSKETLKKSRPILVCEVFSGEMLKQIGDLLSSDDYQPYIFSVNRLVPSSFEDYSSINKIENFFFIPTEKEHWIKDFI